MIRVEPLEGRDLAELIRLRKVAEGMRIEIKDRRTEDAGRFRLVMAGRPVYSTGDLAGIRHWLEG